MSNVLTFLDKATRWLDEVDSVDAIFLDFLRAFDKVPHTCLIRSLRPTTSLVNSELDRGVAKQ